MFNTDKPINNLNEDKLGRATFARQLANAIMSYNTTDNYAISLQGKWGCGKTSVLNMAVEEIRLLSESLEEKNKIVIIEFNPWNFTDTSQLINQFFVTLTNSLKLENKEEKAKKVGAAIEKYSSALEYSEYIPLVGKYLKLLPKLSAAFGKSIKDKSDSQLNDVSYRKKEVEKALYELESRILVVIDDIDRLSNEQIRLIFQLVSAVAGLPNITYLLSFDKDIVARALGDVQHCDGEEYLEKIIQVPFDVPPLDVSKLHNILFEKLNTLIELNSGLEFDKKRWGKVFNSCINPFVETLRDVNRYYNAFSFMYKAVKTEVDFIDMAGISALRVFAPAIFEWIRANKFSLVGGYSGGGYVINELNKRKDETLQRFQETYPQNPTAMLNAVSSLFPNFSNSVLYPIDLTTPNQLHQAMRIATESKFDLYFSLSLDKIKISRSEVDKSLLSMEEAELRDYINYLDDHELFDDYLGEIKYNLLRIPEGRIELFLSVLVFQSGRIAEESATLIGNDIETISIYTISDILFRLEDENARYAIIIKMLSNSDFLSFQFLLHLLHIIELTHGRVAETNYIREDKLVSLEHLYELERIFLERTDYFLRTIDLLDWKEARRASFLWEFIEKDSYRDYMVNALREDIAILKYISIKAGKWTSSNMSYSYSFTDKSYEEYVSNERVLEKIDELRMTEAFWKLDIRVIEIAVAFTLQKTADKETGVDISLINEKMDIWKKEFQERTNRDKKSNKTCWCNYNYCIQGIKRQAVLSRKNTSASRAASAQHGVLSIDYK